MSSKYIVFKCDVCERETELALDGRRPDPLRCNITLNCRGKFSRIGDRTSREFLFTPLVSGLSDFIPRGTEIIPAPQLSVPNPITIFTASGDGIVTMSVIRRDVVGADAIFSVIDENDNSFTIESHPSIVVIPITSLVRMVLFEISPELLVYKKYIYSLSNSVQIVNGIDDSPEGQNLRFGVSNQIAVYVNGILLDPSAYDRSVDNQITFTPIILETNNIVEVFVYNDLLSSIDNSKKVSLEFRSLRTQIPADLALRELTCWGNYGAVSVDSQERMLLFCTDLSNLNRNKSYGVSHFEITSTISGTTRKIKTSEVFIVLGREPFSFRDKELYAYLAGTSLVDLQSILTYKESLASGDIFLTVDDSVITQVYNPIRVSKKIIAITTLTTDAAASGTALEGTEKLKPKYIIGPV